MPNQLEKAVLAYSQRGFKQLKPLEVPGSTPIVTGDIAMDHFLHHMLIDNGIRVTVRKGNIMRMIDEVEIVDQDKASWFLLKWS